MKTCYDPIEIFVNYFRDKIDVISQAKFGDYCVEHQTVKDLKRLLFCCLIDAMSDSIALPPERDEEDDQQKDKARFRTAIKDYGNWPDYDRICRPYLEALLEEETNPRFDSIRTLIQRLPAWPQRHVASWTAVNQHDPAYEEVNKIWPRSNGKECKVAKVNIGSVTHVMFLYHFRNELIHKMEPSIHESTLPLGQTQPYYVRVSDMSKGKREYCYWQLEHPPKFMESLARSILTGLEKDFRNREVNPLKLLHDHRHLPGRPCTFARELDIALSSHIFTRSLSWSDKGLDR